MSLHQSNPTTLRTSAARLTALAAILAPLWLSATAAAATSAPVYKTTDEHGNVVFTDNPEGRPAQHVELSEPVIVPGGVVSDRSYEPAPDPDSDAEDAQSYSLELMAPQDQETIRNNAGQIDIDTWVTPPLREDDYIQLIFDGVATDTSTNGHFSLQSQDRGEHQVQVEVRSRDGDVLTRSAVHTIYLFRASAN